MNSPRKHLLSPLSKRFNSIEVPMRKSNTKKNLPIFFSCDENYTPFLSVALQSLMENAASERNYIIKVLHSGSIKAQTQNRLETRYSTGNFHVEFVDISDHIKEFSERLHTRDYYSKSTYYRLFIPKMYPQFDKALYLDSDIVVLGDIARLYDTYLGGNLVGAATDEFVQQFPVLKDYVVNRVGVKMSKHYFNAGILLMNLRKLREIDFEEIFLNLLSQVKFDIGQDQDYLNAICRNRVTYFSDLWNKMPLSKCVGKLRLIHYNLDMKPWQKDDVMYGEYFWEYAKRTDFYDAIVQYKNAYNAQLQQTAASQTSNLMASAHNQATDEAQNKKIGKIIQSVCSVHNKNEVPGFMLKSAPRQFYQPAEMKVICE